MLRLLLTRDRGPLLSRMLPVTFTYFCYGWGLWLYLNWLPLFFKNSFGLDLKNSALFASGVFFAGVIGGLLSFGLIGLFVGPVVLAVAYTLLQEWMGEQESA